jgi:3-methyladenine DNA glycosylase AlkD
MNGDYFKAEVHRPFRTQTQGDFGDMALKNQNADRVLSELRGLANPDNATGMARFGIVAKAVLGIGMVPLRTLAKRIGTDHALAVQLWSTGVFEAKILAGLIGDPGKLTRYQAKSWAEDFENWADCDGTCLNLFRKARFAHSFAVECARRNPEFVKRTGFTLMATLAVHDKGAADDIFLRYLRIVEGSADDGRNGVKKAVNWALRQIGKRDQVLRTAAVETAERIRQQNTPAARWIASDALREFRRVPVRTVRLRKSERR